jgi:Lrp/AsnC family transcriptional regulator, leucine-responsive regulatory protein
MKKQTTSRTITSQVYNTQTHLVLTTNQKKILTELLKNSRTSVTAIAKLPYLTKDIVAHNLKLLEQNGIIKAFISRIEQSFFCQGVAQVQLKIKESSQQNMEFIIRTLNNHPQINWFAQTCGFADIICTFLFKDLTQLQQTLDEISTQSFVKSHTIHLYTKELKFERNGLIDEGVVSQNSQVTFTPKSYDFDDIDKIILRKLAKNSRIRNNQLAVKTNLGEDAIRERIKKLEEKKIISGYTIVIDTHKLGYEGYILFIQSEQSHEQVSKFVSKIAQITHCAQMTGQFNYSFSIETRTRNEFSEILIAIRQNLQAKDYTFLLKLNEHKEVFVPSELFE